MASNNLPEYLVEELNKIAKNNGFVDFEIEQDAGSKHGDGFMATMVNIKVSGKRTVDGVTKANDELNLICKLLPTNVARRELFNSGKVFDREVAMYNTVLPIFVRFQEEKGLTSENGFFDFPKCYFAVSDSETDRHVIIMDDLRTQGFLLWDKLQPIEYENVRLLMTALGRYHALSFAIRDQRPEVFATFKDMSDVMLEMMESTPAMEEIFQAGLKQSLSFFKEKTVEYTYLENTLNTWKQTFHNCLGDNVAEPFAVVGHGDCWNNNMMFLSNSEKKPQQISMLDWQLSRLGSPVLDLSYFFMSSTAKPLRDKHFDEFLQIYYTNLANTLRACGSDPETLFSFENLQDELKKFGHFGVTMAPMLLSIIVNDPSNIVQMDDFAENIDEHKTMAKFDKKSEERYVSRVADVINDGKTYGWLKH